MNGKCQQSTQWACVWHRTTGRARSSAQAQADRRMTHVQRRSDFRVVGVHGGPLHGRIRAGGNANEDGEERGAQRGPHAVCDRFLDARHKIKIIEIHVHQSTNMYSILHFFTQKKNLFSLSSLFFFFPPPSPPPAGVSFPHFVYR